MRCKNPIKIIKRGQFGIKNNYLFVGCGKCVACMEKKRNEMSLRNYFELLECQGKATFITLTYNDDNIPIINGNPSLNMRDFQLFMKKLRKSIEPLKIRFYGCGEYGPTTHRPHYHVIIYNLKFTYDLQEKLQKTWQHGFVTCRACDFVSIRYTTKYMLTKLYDNWQPPVREFRLSSRNPGIGLPYLANHPELKTIFVDNLCDTYTMPGGYKLSLDRYLKSKIYSDTDRLDISRKHEEYFAQHYMDEYNEFVRLYPSLSPDTEEFTRKINAWRKSRYDNWESIKLKKISKSAKL